MDPVGARGASSGEPNQPPNGGGDGGGGGGNGGGVEPPDLAQNDLITSAGGSVASFYIFRDSVRCPIDPATMGVFGLDPASAIKLTTVQMNRIKLGPPFTITTDGNLLVARTAQSHWFMQGGQRRLIPDAATETSLIGDAPLRGTVDDAQLALIPTGLPLPSRADGTLLKGSGDPIFVMMSGVRRFIPDPQTFGYLGFSLAAVRGVADADLSEIPRGGDLPSRADGTLLKGSADPVYRMEDGNRRWIPDPTTFALMGLSWSAVRSYPQPDIDAIPRGADFPSTPIQHVVVVMIENRSFDHLLGYLKETNPEINGLTAATQGNYTNVGPSGPVHPSSNAGYLTIIDPGHELNDSLRQVRYSGTTDMAGFVADYADKCQETGFDPGHIMSCFHPDRLPIVSTLARTFGVCDQWFASLPGPTLPNRLFVHVGTCRGYAKSPPINVNFSTLLAFGSSFATMLVKAAIKDLIDQYASTLTVAGSELALAGIGIAIAGAPFIGGFAAALGIVVGGVKLFESLLGLNNPPDPYPQLVQGLVNSVIDGNPEMAYFLGLRGDPYPPSIYELLETTLPGQATNAWRVYVEDYSETMIVPFLRQRMFDEMHVGLSHPEAPVFDGAFWKGAGGNFRTFGQFLADAIHGDLPRFSFVQPRMENILGLTPLSALIKDPKLRTSEPLAMPPPNDAHPPHDVRDMEAFVGKIYDALRASPAWPNTLMLLVADEHGGFYDHVPPPQAVPPDRIGYNNVQPGEFWHRPDDPDFDFSQLGVRVPAIVISPYVSAGSVSHVVHDHTSIGATLRQMFGLPGPFTARMAAANPITAGFALTGFRTDTPEEISRRAVPPAPGWQSLGGFPVSTPVVATNQDGRLEVFYRGPDGCVHHMWETAPGSGSWSRWDIIDWNAKIQGTPAVIANQDGRLEVFARGANNDLLHAWQTAPNSGWSAFTSLGGAMDGDPVAARNADGRLEVFVPFVSRLEVDVGHIWQTSAGGGWSTWATLYYQRPNDPLSIGELDLIPPFTVVLGPNKLLTIFGTLTYYYRPGSTPTILNGPRIVWRNQNPQGAGGWDPWLPDAAPEGGNPLPLLTPDGSVSIIARSADTRLLLLGSNADGTFSPRPGPLDGGFTTGFAAAINSTGWIEVVALDSNGVLWQSEQINSGNNWTNWQNLGGAVAQRPALARDAKGRMIALGTGLDGSIWIRSQKSPEVW